jgi:hypothetical protein
MKILALICLLQSCFLITKLRSQENYIKMYDYTNIDRPNDLVKVHDGYVVLMNCIQSPDSSPPPNLLKISKLGELVWTHNPVPIAYTSDFPITSHRIAVTADSSILICGRLGISDSLASVFVSKLNQNGELLWRKTYKESYRWYEYYWAEQIATWPNGDFLVTGVYYRKDQGSIIYPDSMFFIKCNANGDVIRETKINYPPVPLAGYEGGDSGNPVMLPNGDIFFCFFARWNAEYHPVLARLDSTLQLIWRKEAEGLFGRSYELKMTDDGNILMYVEGGYNVHPSGSDPIIQKLTPDGDSLWTYSPPGLNAQQCYDMATLNNGDIVFTGTPSNFEWLRCISPQGKYKWHRKFKPPDSRDADRLYLSRIIGTADGGMLIAGFYQKYPNNPEDHLDDDIILIKLDSMGCITPGCGVEEIFVGTNDLVEGVAQPRTFRLQPNPASDAVTLIYPGWQEGQQTIIDIFDLAGKRIKSLSIDAVVSEISINTLPKGIYLVRLYSSSGTSQTQKLVKN